jgi:hypothetical protein
MEEIKRFDKKENFLKYLKEKKYLKNKRSSSTPFYIILSDCK